MGRVGVVERLGDGVGAEETGASAAEITLGEDMFGILCTVNKV